jgi:hypothetical protein
MEVITPQFHTDNDTSLVLLGEFITKSVGLDDKVYATPKHNVGTAPGIESALTRAFMALGVLVMMML